MVNGLPAERFVSESLFFFRRKYSISQTIDSINPSTNEPIARVRQGTIEDYNRIVESSSKAFQMWMNVPAQKRGDIVRQIGDELRKNLQPLGKLVEFRLLFFFRKFSIVTLHRSQWKWVKSFLKVSVKFKNLSIFVIMPLVSPECSKAKFSRQNVSQQII